MGTDANKELVRKVLEEVWHKGDLAAIERLFLPTFANHDPDAPDVRDCVGFRTLVQGLRTAFPDLRITIDRLIGEGDYVAKHWTAQATHRGPLPGLAATDKPITFTGTTIYRMQDGRVAESWWNKDTAGMVKQLS